MFNIKSNNIIFKGFSDKTILKSAQDQYIFIEHSCLNGRCSSCKAKVISGTRESITYELGLTEEERNQGYILTCITKPTSDMVLDLEVLEGVILEKPKIIPTKIHSVDLVSINVIKLVLRFPPTMDFKFLPGQYVNIIKGNIKRSYSIGGIDKSGNLVFYIKYYQNGKMSDYLFNMAKEHDLLRIEGPLGSFFLRENSLKNIIFLATGTGIAPIISMLSSEFNNKIISNKNVFLFHGGKFESDLLEKDTLIEYNISYVPVLSREEKENFFFGYVQDIVVNKNIDLSDATVYACGSSNMIEASKVLLISHGLHPKQFYSDAFVESN